MRLPKRLLVVLLLSFGPVAAVIPATPAVAQSQQDVEDLIDQRIAQLQAEIDANPGNTALDIANSNRIAQLQAIRGVLGALPPEVLQVLYEFFLERVSPSTPS